MVPPVALSESLPLNVSNLVPLVKQRQQYFLDSAQDVLPPEVVPLQAKVSTEYRRFSKNIT